jgi:hypothetical protein
MQEAAGDGAKLQSIAGQCRIVEVRMEKLQVSAVAHIPLGYCESLRQTFDGLLSHQVQHGWKRDFVLEYKGVRLFASIRDLAQHARIESRCEPGGSMQLAAPRRR